MGILLKSGLTWTERYLIPQMSSVQAVSPVTMFSRLHQVSHCHASTPSGSNSDEIRDYRKQFSFVCFLPSWPSHMNRMKMKPLCGCSPFGHKAYLSEIRLWVDQFGNVFWFSQDIKIRLTTKKGKPGSSYRRDLSESIYLIVDRRQKAFIINFRFVGFREFF